ncbi:hypothetical protein [Klebsiella pneumoniae]|uniref:hypothetical protein n=1 Tax=Klebsiella pneumoniae TaxID=573 RepID=UPI0005B37822|nr:hypothetical protein [Klebsiella pneumoniae]
MLVRKRLELLEHFYFCFLVACNLKRKQHSHLNDNVIKQFMYEWLTTAEQSQIFHRSLSIEVKWLKSELLTLTVQEIISILNRIYYALAQEQLKLNKNQHSILAVNSCL